MINMLVIYMRDFLEIINSANDKELANQSVDKGLSQVLNDRISFYKNAVQSDDLECQTYMILVYNKSYMFHRLTGWESKILFAQWGKVRMRGRDSQGVWDRHVHTAIFKMEHQKRPTVQYRELYSMLCGQGRRVWGERIHVYVWLSPFVVYLIHCQSAIIKYRIKSLIKEI